MSKLLTSNRTLLYVIGFLSIVYTLFIGFDLISHINCWSSGLDFCAYWSSGKVALDHGVQGVYDLDILGKYQAAIFPSKFEAGAPYEYVPFPYPPVFVLPFEFFALLPLQTAYLLWTGLKLTVFGVYMWFLYRSVVGSDIPWRVFIVIMFSAPLFNELRFGQMNLWLAVIIGEFVRNMIKGRKFLAGFLLSLVSIKFQLLVLIVPFLLIKREWRAIMGLAIGGFLLAIGSILVAGMDGIQGFLLILSNSMAGHSAANVQRMANWRMIGETIDRFIHPSLGIYVVSIGIVFTLFLLGKALRENTRDDAERQIFEYGLIFLATTIVTWHSHVEMNMIFAPYLLIAVSRRWVHPSIVGIWFASGVFQFVLIQMIAESIKAFMDVEFSITGVLVLLQVFYFGINLKMFTEWVRSAKLENNTTMGNLIE